MFIKKILTYDFNYAEYIVSDGKHDIVCMCLSVPLPNNTKPSINMNVKKIYAFSLNSIELKTITDSKDKHVNIERKDYFKYQLRAKVLDSKNSLVCLGGLKISLENDYPDGFPINILNDDYIEFNVDRLDCEL